MAAISGNLFETRLF